MLLEHSKTSAVVRMTNMAAKFHSPLVRFQDSADDSLVAASRLKKNGHNLKSRKSAELLDDRFGIPMQEKPAKNVQETFKNLRKHRQDDGKHMKRLLRLQRQWKRDPHRMEKLRHKFVEQCKRYFGVPYARKYWSKDSPEYNSPLFLDCCGLVRQVMRDMERDFGFHIGPWNQAYMYDTLPVCLTESQMRPGDLVFMTGTYVHRKHKRQRHNMMHVEVWLGEGCKTIGARWNNGKVQVFDSYRFHPKSFTNEQYLFRSIDPWLMGICKSYCKKHKWGMSTYQTSTKKPIFLPEENLPLQDQRAGDDEDDNDENNNTNNDENNNDKDPRKGGDQLVGPGSERAITEETREVSPTRKKKRCRKGRKVIVSRSCFLPQATKAALLRLEDRLDHLVARSRPIGDPASKKNGNMALSPTATAASASAARSLHNHHHQHRRKEAPGPSATMLSFSSSSSSCKSMMKGRREGGGIGEGGGGGVLAARPSMYFDVFERSVDASSTASGGAGFGIRAASQGPQQLRCPVIGDCNSQPTQYVPNLMPKRYDSSLLITRALPKAPDLTASRRPKWFNAAPRPVTGGETSYTDLPRIPPHRHPQKRVVPRDRSSCYARPSHQPGRGSGGRAEGDLGEGRRLLTKGVFLSVVGSNSARVGLLKENKSCTDLETLSTRSRLCISNRTGSVVAAGTSRSVSVCSSNSTGWSQKDSDTLSNASHTTNTSQPHWRFAAPNARKRNSNLFNISNNINNNNPQSFSAQFMQDLRERDTILTPTHPTQLYHSTITTPSLAATCCMEAEDEEEEEEEEVEQEEEDVSETSQGGRESTMSMACDCEECWLEGLMLEQNSSLGKEEDLVELDLLEEEENEEMDTDEELEGYHQIDYTVEEEDGEEDTDSVDEYLEEEEVNDSGEEDVESNENDNLVGATLSFSYSSKWNVSESQYQSRILTSIFPLRSATDLQALDPRLCHGGRYTLPEKCSYSQDNGVGCADELPKIASSPALLLGNCNNNASNPQSARTHVKSPLRFSLASRENRPSTSHATSTTQRVLLSARPQSATRLTGSGSGLVMGSGLGSGATPALSTSTTSSKANAPRRSNASHSPRPTSSREAGETSSATGAPSQEEKKSWKLVVTAPSEVGGGEMSSGKESSSIPDSTPTSPSGVIVVIPSDGDEKSTRVECGGGGGGASGGEPSESEQVGSEEAGGEGVGEGGGGGRSGDRRGGKRTPGGRPTKLPACCLPANMTPTFFIGGGNGVALVETPLLALGWKRTLDKYDERFRLKWVECKSKINYTTFKEGEQLVNHIPNCKLLTNKMGLLCSLQEYERVTLAIKGRPPRLKMSDFVPETYKLDEKIDRATFLNLYKEGEMWICKPVGMNQGKGIFLLRSREEIENLLAERDAKRETSKHTTRPPMVRIVQRYIMNPLLLDDRKFDIRSYMLIASTVPFLVLFHHGYIRLSCLKYDGNDTNLTTHLTNQSVQLSDPDYRKLLSQDPEQRFMQKKDPNYKEIKEDTAWSMDKFNSYINTHYAAQKGIEEDWAFNTLTKQMQRIMLHCFNTVKHRLQCKIGYFDLYGLDFMVDADMKVWLIEVNVNPALHINCEALKEVIPGVVEETLHVSIEAFEKSRKNQPLMPMQSLKGFQVIHCDNPCFSVAPRQTRSVSPAKGENPEQRGTGVRVAQTAHAHSRQPQSPPRPMPRMSVSTTQVQAGGTGSSTVKAGKPCSIINIRLTDLVMQERILFKVMPNASTAHNNAAGGGPRSSQTCMPGVSHSNTNINQSTHGKPNTTTSTSTGQSSQRAAFNASQPPAPKLGNTNSTGQSGGGGNTKPLTAPLSSSITTLKTTYNTAGNKANSTAAPVPAPRPSVLGTGGTAPPVPTPKPSVPGTGSTAAPVPDPRPSVLGTGSTAAPVPDPKPSVPGTGSTAAPVPDPKPSVLGTGSTAAPVPDPKPSVPGTGHRQPIPTIDVKVGGDDVRLKMMQVNSTSSKKHHREMPDRGN